MKKILIAFITVLFFAVVPLTGAFTKISAPKVVCADSLNGVDTVTYIGEGVFGYTSVYV